MAQNRYRKSLRRFIEQSGKTDDVQREFVIDTLRSAGREISLAFPSVTRMSLVGSIIKGGFSEDSDVDIVVMGLKKEEYLGFKSYIEARLKRTIDLIMEEDIGERERAILLSKIEVVYDAKAKKRG